MRITISLASLVLSRTALASLNCSSRSAWVILISRGSRSTRRGRVSVAPPAATTVLCLGLPSVRLLLLLRRTHERPHHSPGGIENVDLDGVSSLGKEIIDHGAPVE